MRKFFSFVAAAFVALTMNAQAISVADAIAEGMKLDSMGVSEAEYTVEGFVINAGSFSLQYMNQSWFMADEEGASASDFQAYNCYPIEGSDTLKVLNGDKVSVTGKLKKYYNKSQAKYIIEIEKGDASFISKVDGDHSVVIVTEEITIAQALEIGAALADNASTEKQYKLHGFVSADVREVGEHVDGFVVAVLVDQVHSLLLDDVVLLVLANLSYGELDVRVEIKEVGEGAAEEDEILVDLVTMRIFVYAEGLREDLEPYVVLRAGELARASEISLRGNDELARAVRLYLVILGFESMDQLFVQCGHLLVFSI